MISELVRGIFFNASLLFAISIIYNTFFKFEKNKKYNNVVIGTVIGFIGILVMLNTVKVTSGIIFDTRSILVSITAMFFGLVTTVISASIIIAYRVIIGGDGVAMGVMVTLLSAGIGLLWHYFRIDYIFKKKNYVWIEFYVFGLIVHIGMLLCTFVLPRDYTVVILKQIFAPVIFVYPIGSLLLCMVIFTGYKNIETKLALEDSEKRYKELYFEHQNKQVFLMSLINSIPDLMFIKI